MPFREKSLFWVSYGTEHEYTVGKMQFLNVKSGSDNVQLLLNLERLDSFRDFISRWRWICYTYAFLYN
jgi:hypothetical protein